MPIPVIEVHALSQIFSPFSGLPADGEDGANENDPTLLFVYYGNAGDFAYFSDRLDGLIEGDIDELDIDALSSLLSVEGALVLKVDTEWNGINFYGFAPAG